MTDTRHLKPAWKANLLIIGSLIGIILAYYYWQLRYGEETFRKHVSAHTKMVAEIIKLNVGREALSRDVVEEVITTFLGNAARFVDYLDTVEPFSASELTAFSEEAGLAGIRIRRRDGKMTEGPPDWIKENIPCTSPTRLVRMGQRGYYALAIPGMETGTCIVVGMMNDRIATLEEQISLSRLLTLLPGLAGIRYVRLDKIQEHRAPASVPSVKIMLHGGHMVAEGRLQVDRRILVVGIEARHFGERLHQLRFEFLSFSIIIALLGGGGTWLLHRRQSAYLNQARRYERQLAREKEDAALGRASATITHEIRNPLNAISMGLQRLQIEANGLSDDHQALLATLRQAVVRTDGIIKELHRYSKAIEPKLGRIRLEEVLTHALDLYQSLCQQQRIVVHTDVETDRRIRADRHLMEEALENLIKNAIEATPLGGEIFVHLFEESGNVILSLKNPGFEFPEQKAHEILEPYFTTKTKGSGLGLSIVHRIIRAHGGTLLVSVPRPGFIKISIKLPLRDMGS